MMSELKQLRRKRIALNRKIRERMVNDLIAMMDAEEWPNKEEMAAKLFGKKIPTDADMNEAYRCIQQIRRICEDSDEAQLLVCRNNRYGWAEDKETIDSYTEKNVRNGLRKIERNRRRLPKNYRAIGVDDDGGSLIGRTLGDFGYLQIEHKEQGD